MLREHGVHRPSVFEVLEVVHRMRGTKSRFAYVRVSIGVIVVSAHYYNTGTSSNKAPVAKEAAIPTCTCAYKGTDPIHCYLSRISNPFYERYTSTRKGA